ncbi:MAG: HEPN domain-containing protein [Dermatophilaceae bacterium]
MSPWSPGRATVEDLISARKITRLAGADAGRDGLMERARQQLLSATALIESDPATAYVVAYDAAKHAAMALLAEQNLRPTHDGGHLAMEQVLTAQFHGVFSGFSRLRRRRNELDYPSSAEDFADTGEARRAIEAATTIVDNALELLERGVLTTF